MKFRMAVMQDLEQLKAVYRETIRDMGERGIDIWDDIYPCEFFADDIKNKRLYVLAEGAYDMVFDDGFVLHGAGYEVKCE